MRWFGFAIVSALVGTASVPAYADDAAKKLPNNRPSEIVAPVNWTGFYIGGDIGGLSRKGRGTSDFFQESETARNFAGPIAKQLVRRRWHLRWL